MFAEPWEYLTVEFPDADFFDFFCGAGKPDLVVKDGMFGVACNVRANIDHLFNLTYEDRFLEIDYRLSDFCCVNVRPFCAAEPIAGCR
ncbi:hypothetical protein [Tunturibacter empetritectus]|uniref:Uncharacterized protein n=1 Tax=Tunturiibacter lichenicola TaxID=2051959 RepID=A0A7W8J770_9BACT|nr:hypothetical protein [Edaphobacter lichenicola]MBB5343869.1 hypothetical protein [Edaphobacter lichenicola]